MSTPKGLFNPNPNGEEQIFRNAADLEALGIQEAPVAGRWSLVYSTQTSGESEEERNCFFGGLWRVLRRFLELEAV